MLFAEEVGYSFSVERQIRIGSAFMLLILPFLRTTSLQHHQQRLRTTIDR